MKKGFLKKIFVRVGAGWSFNFVIAACVKVHRAPHFLRAWSFLDGRTFCRTMDSVIFCEIVLLQKSEGFFARRSVP